MRAPIPAVPDIPSKEPKLGFQEYAEAITDAILGVEPPQFTIGIYGAWGTGKSSLLNGIQNELAKVSNKATVAYLDAWRYERAGHIILPLLNAVSRELERTGRKKPAGTVKKAMIGIAKGLTLSLGPASFSFDEVRKALVHDPAKTLDEGFSEPLETLKELANELGDHRIVVLVDDLDRCSPAHVIELLESINLVLDLSGFVFVLALDYGALAAAVEAHFEHLRGSESRIDGNAFIQKMIQLPFQVPPLDVDRPTFLEELIPGWERLGSSLGTGETETFKQVAEMALGSNPRQTKRLLNSFLLIDRLLSAKSLQGARPFMFPLLGLQLQWPDAYESLKNACLTGDQTPFKTLGERAPEFKAYVEKFFSNPPAPDRLAQIIQLTESFSIDEQASVAEDISSFRGLASINASRLIEFLLEKGFERHPLSERAFYHPEVVAKRIVVGKIVVRLERQNHTSSGRRWQLVRSISLAVDPKVVLERIIRWQRLAGSDTDRK